MHELCLCAAYSLLLFSYLGALVPVDRLNSKKSYDLQSLIHCDSIQSIALETICEKRHWIVIFLCLLIFLHSIITSISCAFITRSLSLQILGNSFRHHSVLMLLSLSSVTKFKTAGKWQKCNLVSGMASVASDMGWL